MAKKKAANTVGVEGDETQAIHSALAGLGAGRVAAVMTSQAAIGSISILG